jgi:hypothetical protein
MDRVSSWSTQRSLLVIGVLGFVGALIALLPGSGAFADSSCNAGPGWSLPVRLAAGGFPVVVTTLYVSLRLKRVNLLPAIGVAVLGAAIGVLVGALLVVSNCADGLG